MRLCPLEQNNAMMSHSVHWALKFSKLSDFKKLWEYRQNCNKKPLSKGFNKVDWRQLLFYLKKRLLVFFIYSILNPLSSFLRLGFFFSTFPAVLTGSFQQVFPAGMKAWGFRNPFGVSTRSFGAVSTVGVKTWGFDSSFSTWWKTSSFKHELITRMLTCCLKNFRWFHDAHNTSSSSRRHHGKLFFAPSITGSRVRRVGIRMWRPSTGRQWGDTVSSSNIFPELVKTRHSITFGGFFRAARSPFFIRTGALVFSGPFSLVGADRKQMAAVIVGLHANGPPVGAGAKDVLFVRADRFSDSQWTVGPCPPRGADEGFINDSPNRTSHWLVR